MAHKLAKKETVMKEARAPSTENLDVEVENASIKGSQQPLFTATSFAKAFVLGFRANDQTSHPTVSSVACAFTASEIFGISATT